MRSNFVCVLLACALLAVPSSTRAQAEVVGHLQIRERVVDRVYVMRQPDRVWSTVIGNVTIIEQSNGVVVFDTGSSPRDGERVVAQVRAITSNPVKAVVLSHWHNDHPLGLPALLKAWPNARVIGTRGTSDGLRETMGKIVGVGGPDAQLEDARYKRALVTAEKYEENARDPKLSAEEREAFRMEAPFVRARAEEGKGSYVILPTEIVDDRLVLADNVAPIELLHLGRANTDGDLVAWLPRQKTVITGDVVVAPVPYGFNSYPAEWVEVLKKIKGLNFSHLVPGHGPVQTNGLYVDRLISALSKVRAQVGALAAQGLSEEQVLARMDHNEQTRKFAEGDPWAMKLLGGFWLNPITSSAYREAKNSQ